MVVARAHCPHCFGSRVVKRGKTLQGKQRYLCQNPACAHQTFLLDYDHQGHLPATKRKIIDMALHGEGIRGTARLLKISPTTVVSVLKKLPPSVVPPKAARRHGPSS